MRYYCARRIYTMNEGKCTLQMIMIMCGAIQKVNRIRNYHTEKVLDCQKIKGEIE